MNSDQIEAARLLIDLTRSFVKSQETGWGIPLGEDECEGLAEAADTLEAYLDS